MLTSYISLIPTIGEYCLILAICMCFLQIYYAFFYNKIALIKVFFISKIIFILTAFVILIILLISNDFSTQYVAENSNTNLPIIYKIAAAWGAHEGSFLLWVLLLTTMLMIFVFSVKTSLQLTKTVIMVSSLVILSFLLFLLITSNPFIKIYPVPLEGRDLNPLLQDPLLVIHPPMLYLGYVGFAVPFVWVSTMLIHGDFATSHFRILRLWANLAWVFLTSGIALGSFWAYYELGWGGWWFWDPVENSSFLPWLTGLALIHILIVIDKKENFKSWGIIIALSCFILSLIGTFLVRSGILTSVHAFASDPLRGAIILFIILILSVIPLGLFILRFNQIQPLKKDIPFLSLESFLWLNNMILICAMLIILLGTLYPLIIDVLGLGKISVGAPYFNSIFIPLMAFFALLMAWGQIITWQKDKFFRVYQKSKISFLLAIIVAILIAFLYKKNYFYISFASFLSSFIIFILVADLISKIKNHTLKFHYFAMFFAHTGFAIFIIGAVFSTQLKQEQHFTLKVNEQIEVFNYKINFKDMIIEKRKNYIVLETKMQITTPSGKLFFLNPEKRFFHSQKSLMTEAKINSSFFKDTYLAMGEKIDNKWGFRFYIKPFVQWLWWGVIFMIIGALLGIIQKKISKLKKTTVNPSLSL